MDTIEIKNDEINVEDIMRQIRENIKKRKESGAYTKEMETLINEPLQAPCETSNAGQDDLQQNLNYINSNWDVHAEYSISSHRPILGRLLVWGRKLIHGEVRRYVDLISGKQIEFNAHVVRVLNGCVKGFDSKVNEAVVATKKPSSYHIDKVMNYFLFEEKFRGTSEEIKQRQSIYVEYFKNCQNVLDIGCGRGEFLSLLKENAIGAKGIDINEDMLFLCKKNGLDIQKAEAISYLQSLEDKSLDGVFSAQVVEHLHPEELINIVKLCYDKMKYGTFFIVETVNILNPGALANFFVDPTHKWPVHPEFIEFIIKDTGFRESKIVYRIYDKIGMDVDNHKIKEFAPDYALICKK
jgi:SAM-dependent methyltransferase